MKQFKGNKTGWPSKTLHLEHYLIQWKSDHQKHKYDGGLKVHTQLMTTLFSEYTIFFFQYKLRVQFSSISSNRLFLQIIDLVLSCKVNNRVRIYILDMNIFASHIGKHWRSAGTKCDKDNLNKVSPITMHNVHIRWFYPFPNTRRKLILYNPK